MSTESLSLCGLHVTSDQAICLGISSASETQSLPILLLGCVQTRECQDIAICKPLTDVVFGTGHLPSVLSTDFWARDSLIYLF